MKEKNSGYVVVKADDPRPLKWKVPPVNDLRPAIELLKQVPGQYLEIDRDLDPVGELAGVYRHIGAGGTVTRPTRIGPAMMFNNIKGFRGGAFWWASTPAVSASAFCSARQSVSWAFRWAKPGSLCPPLSISATSLLPARKSSIGNSKTSSLWTRMWTCSTRTTCYGRCRRVTRATQTPCSCPA